MRRLTTDEERILRLAVILPLDEAKKLHTAFGAVIRARVEAEPVPVPVSQPKPRKRRGRPPKTLTEAAAVNPPM